MRVGICVFRNATVFLALLGIVVAWPAHALSALDPTPGRQAVSPRGGADRDRALSDIRTCGGSALPSPSSSTSGFDLGSCASDESSTPISATAAGCSVHAAAAGHLTGRIYFENRETTPPQPFEEDVPPGGGHYTMAWDFRNVQLPGGRWRCTFTLGAPKAVDAVLATTSPSFVRASFRAGSPDVWSRLSPAPLLILNSLPLVATYSVATSGEATAQVRTGDLYSKRQLLGPRRILGVSAKLNEVRSRVRIKVDLGTTTALWVNFVRMLYGPKASDGDTRRALAAQGDSKAVRLTTLLRRTRLKYRTTRSRVMAVAFLSPRLAAFTSSAANRAWLERRFGVGGSLSWPAIARAYVDYLVRAYSRDHRSATTVILSGRQHPDETLTDTFETSGPSAPLVGAAICDSSKVLFEHGPCAVDQTGTTIPPTSSLTCSAIAVLQGGKTFTNQLGYSGGFGGSGLPTTQSVLASTVFSYVAPNWTYGGGSFGTGTYHCYFSIDGVLEADRALTIGS